MNVIASSNSGGSGGGEVDRNNKLLKKIYFSIIANALAGIFEEINKLKEAFVFFSFFIIFYLRSQRKNSIKLLTVIILKLNVCGNNLIL